MTNQVELKPGCIKTDTCVRIVFRRQDYSYREVFWSVIYSDNRSVLLRPIYNEGTYTPKTQLFDFDQVQLFEASSLLEAVKEAAKDFRG